ncbi:MULTISPECIES: hypothetical protein [unclassified Moorena]|uniref:hypothetical protein n=1 Tax=unclassified Moorena TaxID=2683338 RepID=UPI0013C792B1|nr:MULTISPECIES: hypothetical protein [unclassified Moorena]NEO21010.1 hypothetical protein [Moorena sp. SIO4A5]NEP22785.1 hypothetical protein [Moorena sp. SIO3I6]NEQ58876.1 hypothetical protein [Moorena sp. SIO4A1]
MSQLPPLHRQTHLACFNQRGDGEAKATVMEHAPRHRLSFTSVPKNQMASNTTG